MQLKYLSILINKKITDALTRIYKGFDVMTIYYTVNVEHHN